ncbi:MAG: hypothetical protein ACT4OP_06380 [Actinomycetota bacterium]
MVSLLGLRTEIDFVLSVVAPLGLAAAAPGPALVIDLDPAGPPYPGERSLADWVAEGPTRPELMPGDGAVALLRNGGVAWPDTVDLIGRLQTGWRSVVLRIPPAGDRLPWPVIPVVPLLPGLLAPSGARAAIWQSTSAKAVAPGPGPILPPLGRATLTKLLSPRLVPAGRWIKAWRQVWELPWP